MLHDLTPGSEWRKGLERTKRAPIVVGGIEWLSFKTGIAAYALIATEHAATVWGNPTGHTYTSMVDGVVTGRMHRNEHNALETATAAIKKGLRT